jgi:hypothetical protein
MCWPFMKLSSQVVCLTFEYINPVSSWKCYTSNHSNEVVIAANTSDLGPFGGRDLLHGWLCLTDRLTVSFLLQFRLSFRKFRSIDCSSTTVFNACGMFMICGLS